MASRLVDDQRYACGDTFNRLLMPSHHRADPHNAPVSDRAPDPFNPVGNERLTAGVGVVLLVLTLIELATVLFGVHSYMSLHVFVGFVLIPPVLLKLASTGWRFARYYTRTEAYVEYGPPQIVMRVTAPIFIAATCFLFASGVAMGVVHGRALSIARELHGPASVIWIVIFGLHALVYLKRSVISGFEDLARSTRSSVLGARTRAYLITAALALGIGAGIATVPAQHHWVNLPRHHHHDIEGAAGEARP